MKKRFAFTRKGKRSASQMQPQPPLKDTTLSNMSPDSNEVNYSKSIYDLKLSSFENCLLNNNLSALTISGFPTIKQLSDSWQNILQEYSDALGNAEFNMYAKMFKEVEVMKLNYQMIEILISALRKIYSPKFCKELNEMLYVNFKFDINNTDSYFADLDNCQRRMGGLKMNLELKTIEFEEIKKSFDGDGNKKKIDKNYFTSMLIVLSRVNRYRITKDIFVNEYCEYYKQAANETEQMKKNESKTYVRH